LQQNAFNKVMSAVLIKMLVEDQLRKRKLLGWGGGGGIVYLEHSYCQAQWYRLCKNFQVVSSNTHNNFMCAHVNTHTHRGWFWTLYFKLGAYFW